MHNDDDAGAHLRIACYRVLTATSATRSELPPTILASLFRQPSPRSPIPPSSFPSGLQPVGSRDLNAGVQRRVSRTDLDFEQALRTGGTVQLKESLDVDKLGADTSIASISPFSSSPPTQRTHIGQPATPIVVPPTPSPVTSPRVVDQPSSSHCRPSLQSSSSSSNDIFYDAQDSDYQTKRRSMYRSPGTASSPDLATLLRKARERNGAGNNGLKVTTAAPFENTPNKAEGSKTIRQRPSASSYFSPSTSSSPQVTPAPKGKFKSNNVPALDDGTSRVGSPEWVLTSPRTAGSIKDNGAKVNHAKSSVRAKTSAFLGKMLGSSSTRERSRTITSSPSTTSLATYPSTPLIDAFTPPVPPLPPKQDFMQPKLDMSDVFSSPSSVPDAKKDFPYIGSGRRVSEASGTSDQSAVLVSEITGRSRSPSPTTTVKQRSSKHVRVASRSKRRSMSVSDVDLKKVMAAGSSSGRLSGEGSRTDNFLGWDSALKGIISDFKGELSQLDPISVSPLDLRDPSTPPRRSTLAVRALSENVTTRTSSLRPLPKPVASLPSRLPTPRVTLQPVSGAEESILNAVLSSPTETSPTTSEGPIITPRNTSLHTPLRPRLGSNAMGPPRTPSLQHGPRSPTSRNGGSRLTHNHSSSKDSNRLRVQHRSTASNSEPSLVPGRGDGRVLPKLSASSQQDLSTNDLVVNRFNYRPSPSKGEEAADLDIRGKELASRCWAEDEEFLSKDKIAEWLGGQNVINKIVLRYYMDFFDFSNLRLDHAFRRLCAKLYLKGETQQVDRILEEFGRRYFDCNPTTVLGSASVVHAVTYSLLLLNTDLHVAELSNRMSRGQFVRNTLTAIQMQLQPSHGSNSDLSYDDWSSFRAGSDSDVGGTTIRSQTKRSDSITSWNSVTRDGLVTTEPLAGTSSAQLNSASEGTEQPPANSSSVSVALSVQESKALESTPAPAPVVMVHDRNWEIEVEHLLKDMYTAVKNQQILQPISSTLMARSSTSSLTPHGAILRNRSLRGPPDRLANLKRGSIRGLQSILGAQTGVSPYSSNSSFDGRASPAPSFATSNDGMHGSTASFLTPALGFASNLSHTIIRETQEDDNHSLKSDNSSTDISITDEELALLGPPWAKEGMLCRKQYWESTGKRAKSKAWLDVFVVIQKGELSMFTFGDHAHGASSVVGGGNWLENAESVGKVLLAHSLAHALPPPGYNRQRPHCMVLTLASGGVYFFQAGTEELVNEWVATCNYWAARQSKEPLAGGVSNMEYGWNRVVNPLTRVRSISEDNSSVRDTDNSDNMSVRSGRNRLKEIAATVRVEKSPWTDRTFINEWKPPMPPSVASTHDEETQLEALQKHVASLKTDLKQHNELRTPMTNLYQPRTSNAARAMSNWEKKSQYLLTEIVKYDSYIDSLQAAMSLRLKKRGEKALERALVVASPTEDELQDTGAKGRWKGHPDEETIEETEEPPASAGPEPSPVRQHRRELAETGEDC
ncbi:hypothetical protein AcV5_007248 [Taiwanofungus camphoratus]|nr:hypothetical protein AcV5_007248 [Antrodia cinnamomea]